MAVLIMRYLALAVFCLVLDLWIAGSNPDADSDRQPEVQVKTKVVKTKYGRIQGFVSRVGRDAEQQKFVNIFLGIPYASAPTGHQRFGPTRPPVHWSGVLQAQNYGPVCPQTFPKWIKSANVTSSQLSRWQTFVEQVRPRLSQQSEDCLYLNIYAPHEDVSSNDEEPPGYHGGESSRHPVMVFVHGGSYSWGSGNIYDGRVLATYGKLIVVTINFRLGIFGFLNTNVNPERKSRMTNYGLMDQIAALKWIQENIEQFGGDPNSITLFGHDTGAACIHFLMQSPAVVPGLFHRAILMSGTAYSDWAIVEDPVHFAVQMAAQLNCTIPRNMVHEHEEIVSCFRNRSVDELTQLQLDTPTFLTGTGPSRDGILIPADFGTEIHRRPKKRAPSSSYQIIIGMVQDETDPYFSQMDLSEGIGSDVKDKFLRTLIRNTYSYHLNEIFATVQNEYSDWSGWSSAPFHSWGSAKDSVSGIRPRQLQKLVSQALTDKLYVAPIFQTANWANESKFPVYMYIFTHPDEAEDKTGQGQEEDDYKRSFHGSMLPLVFGLPFAPELPSMLGSHANQAGPLSQTLITYWANFAATGNPNRPFNVQSLFGRKPSSGANDVFWDPYSRRQQQFLRIDTSSQMDHHYRLHALSIWLNLIPRLHLAGSDNLYPQHNAFIGQDDPDLFIGVVRSTSFAHGYQVNREFLDGTTQPPTATTCVPLAQQRESAAREPDSLVLLEQASIHAYKQALYLTAGIGGILLVMNVWFLACFFFCRGRLANCGIMANASSHLGPKETSCDTELVGITNESAQNVREVTGNGSGGVIIRRTSCAAAKGLNQPVGNMCGENVRLIRSSWVDSDRDSHSTSSQCSHLPSSADPKEDLDTSSISFIACAASGQLSSSVIHSDKTSSMNHQHHQIRSLQRPLSPSSVSRFVHHSTSTLPHKASLAATSSSGNPEKRRSSRSGSFCRLHEAAAGALHQSSSIATAGHTSSGCRVHDTKSPPESSSSCSKTGTIRRNPNSKLKLTTFKNPEAQFVGSPMSLSPSHALHVSSLPGILVKSDK